MSYERYAYLRFDGKKQRLWMLDHMFHEMGEAEGWPANNRVAHSATMRFIPDGKYLIVPHCRKKPQKHGQKKDKSGIIMDSENGGYGPYGIIVLNDFRIDGALHKGVGVHSGRANRGGENAKTMGCIRTTDEAMEFFSLSMKSSMLMAVFVQNNFDHDPTGRAARHHELHRHNHGHHHARAHHP